MRLHEGTFRTALDGVGKQRKGRFVRSVHIMEEDERPRKMAKLGEQTEEELGPSGGGEAPAVESKTLPEDNDKEDEEDEEDDGDEDENEDDKDEKEPRSETKENAGGDQGAASTLSKNQMKKLRRKEAWEATREDRKAKKKEKIAAKKERKRAVMEEAKKNGLDVEAEGKKVYDVPRHRPYRATLLPLTFVMDCGYDELMIDRERISLASQLTRAYSDNSKAPYCAHYVISSFNKLLKERFDTVLKSYHNWRHVRTMPEDYLHAAELAKTWMTEPNGGQLAGKFADWKDAKPEDGEIVYLSSDSDETLTELKPYSTYIIGGLVDKNRHKAVCYKQAVARGVRTAKLPIGDYIQMASRSVLTTNHVMEIMLRWLETGDWGEAFMQVLPQRKGGKLKDSKTEADATEEADAEQQPAEDEETPDKE